MLLLFFFNRNGWFCSFFTNKFNKPLSHWFDSIYFSTVTSSTIGYGDLYPIDPLENFSERAIDDVCGFILKFFSTKVKSKGTDQDSSF
jgi:hypothetical protein